MEGDHTSDSTPDTFHGEERERNKNDDDDDDVEDKEREGTWMMAISVLEVDLRKGRSREVMTPKCRNSNGAAASFFLSLHADSNA